MCTLETSFLTQLCLLFCSLTDEESRKNWEEYGSPDGPQGNSIVYCTKS